MPKPIGGELALFASATIFAFVTLSVKLASRYYSGYFISGTRFLVGTLLCLGIILWGRRKAGPRPAIVAKKAIVLRGLFGAASMIASYAAIALAGPGRATLLGNTYPLFVALFGALLFKEGLKARNLISLIVCTGGAILVVRDGSGSALEGDLLAIGSALLAGLAVNFVRRASHAGASPFVLYLSPCLFGLPLLALAPLPASSGGPLALACLLFVGIGSFVAQAFMAVGYRSVPAGRGSVIFYWETALTVLLGLLVAGETINLRFLLGLGVILAGLWINRDKALS